MQKKKKNLSMKKPDLPYDPNLVIHRVTHKHLGKNNPAKNHIYCGYLWVINYKFFFFSLMECTSIHSKNSIMITC